MGLADLKRVTDLFVEGMEVPFDVNADPPVLLWVNKLNSFQREEAQRDGLAARSRMVIATRENGSVDYLRFEASLSELDEDGVLTALIDQGNNERFLEAMDELRTDPDWKERLEATTRITPSMGEAEREVVVKLNEEYADELQKRIDTRREAKRLDLQGLDFKSLTEKYRVGWLEGHGSVAFQREYTKTQVYYALRTCQGTRAEVGWDHTECGNHAQRALDDREEVAGLPSSVLDRLMTAVREVEVPGREARFLGAPPSSSERSVQPSAEAEEFTPSIPVVTSPEPVPTF